MTSAKSDGFAQTFAQSGQMQVFRKTATRSVIHEAAHAQDYAAGIKNSAFTSSDAWKQVNTDQCIITQELHIASAGLLHS